jgi:hypothetical protein
MIWVPGIMVTNPGYSQRAMRCCLGAAVALLWLVSTAMPVAAHEIRPAVVEVLLQPDGSYQAEIRLNLEAMLAGIGASHKDSDESENAFVYNRLRQLPPADMEREFALFQADFLKGVELMGDGVRLQPRFRGLSVPAVGDIQLARDSVIELRGQLPAEVRTLTWRWDERFGASVVRVDAANERELYTAYLQPGAGSDVIDLRGVEMQSPWAIFGNYLVIGFEHIVPKGADHILFVIGLYLLSPSWRVLLWQVTAFTLAHTITLALSTLGWVQIPATIVEPLIAASIVYVCVENLFQQRLTRWRPLVVFGFGLLHGLGFASVLSDIGLSPGHFVTGLIAFNLGVELGQLAVLAVCFMLIGLWLRHRPWYRRMIAVPASLAIALVGSYWLVERTLLV